MWQVQHDGVERDWEEAKEYCQSLNLLGKYDWYLPSQREYLESLGDNTFIESGSYWTSSSSYSGYATYFDPQSGDTFYISDVFKYYVRCVRKK